MIINHKTITPFYIKKYSEIMFLKNTCHFATYHTILYYSIFIVQLNSLLAAFIIIFFGCKQDPTYGIISLFVT